MKGEDKTSKSEQECVSAELCGSVGVWNNNFKCI